MELPPTADLRDIFMVSGMDLYADRPIVDVNRPYLRPEILNKR